MIRRKVPNEKTFDGNDQFISTGSTLLDLAISGGRKRGGGIPGGILVEVFGPSSSGKTVLLCEIAGTVQRKGGEIQFKDPESRLNKQFAQIFDLVVNDEDYSTPDTVTETFQEIQKFKAKDTSKINGIFVDSLAALSTNMEMEDGDKYGMRRAKEFSEECRKTCRILTKENILLVCSNQIRQNSDAGPYGQKYKSPGGEAIPFYSSLRLRFHSSEKIKEKVKIAGKEVSRVVGVESKVDIHKSSVWKPYRQAPIIIMFDYGIDDIRANLQFIKTYSGDSVYSVNSEKMGQSLDSAVLRVEKLGLELDLKNQVIDLWEEIEKEFAHERKPKIR